MKRFFGRVRMAEPRVSDAEQELFGGPLRYDMGWSHHEHAGLDLTMMSALRSMPALVGATLRMAWKADRRALIAVAVSEIGQGMAAAAGLLAINAVMHALLAGTGNASQRLHALLPGLLAAAAIGAVNSALDPEAEIEAFDRIRRLAAPNRAVVLVTHRMSGVRHADRIYVLNHGHLTEHGTHDELVAAQGRYATMFAAQAAQYAPSAGIPNPASATVAEPA
ncbi:hypothetical protein ACIQ6K_26855 [Streptomyces sp. NPDC096354]|uniref:hypothetical protein n=1 Tax=Streptomyces sp. NPDC096354 TaxID=3366088 RepID=UPI00382D80FC